MTKMTTLPCKKKAKQINMFNFAGRRPQKKTTYVTVDSQPSWTWAWHSLAPD